MYSNRDNQLITIGLVVSVFLCAIIAAATARAAVQCLQRTTLDVWACLALAL